MGISFQCLVLDLLHSFNTQKIAFFKGKSSISYKTDIQEINEIKLLFSLFNHVK